MSASIPVLALPAEITPVTPGSAKNIDLNQSDVNSQSGFGKLLGEAVAGVSGNAAGSEASPAKAGNLVRQLQSLPHGGKLLPLLNQLMEGAAAAGRDQSEIVAQLTARLEEHSADTGVDPLQAMAAALYQLAETHPRYLGSGAGDPVAVRQWLGDTLATSAGNATGGGVAVTSDSATADAELLSFEKLLISKSIQPPSTSSQLHSELAAALQAIRQLAGGQVTGQDSVTRSDTVPVGVVTTPSPLAATSGGFPSLTLGVPLQQANWDQSLGERIQWLVSQGAQGAQIKLNPAHLGPMEVRIEMHNDQANIQFTATHAVVREALEAALPRLREMFGASGVELVNVDVSSESFAEQQRTGEDQQANGWSGSGDDESENHQTLVETPLIAVPATGRLDLFV